MTTTIITILIIDIVDNSNSNNNNSSNAKQQLLTVILHFVLGTPAETVPRSLSCSELWLQSLRYPSKQQLLRARGGSFHFGSDFRLGLLQNPPTLGALKKQGPPN